MPEPGFFDETHWQFTILFQDEDGVSIDMSARTAWRAILYNKAGAEAFRWLSIGYTSTQGIIDLSFIDQGILILDATTAMHVNVPEGQPYTWTLYDITTSSDPIFIALGRSYIGRPGESHTTFEVIESYRGSFATAVVLASPDTLAARDAAIAAAAAAAISASAAADSASSAALHDGSALAAEAEAEAAAISAAASEAAAALSATAAAALSGPIYPDVASGLAVLTNGDVFLVQGDDPTSGLDIYRDIGGSPEAAEQIGSLAGSAEVAAIEARLEYDAPGLGFLGGTLDGLIVSARIDVTTGQLIEAICAGSGDEAVRYAASADGYAKQCITASSAPILLDGGNFVAPAARLDFIDVLAQQLFSPEPATVSITDSLLVAYNIETTLTGQCVDPTSFVMTRLDTMAVLVKDVDYIVRQPDRGVIMGIVNAPPWNTPVTGGVICSIAYDYTKQRIDIITADTDGVLTLTQGDETNRAPAMFQPEVPTREVLVYRGLRYPNNIDLVQSYRYRNGVPIGKEASYQAQVERSRRLLKRTLLALQRQTPVTWFGIGDSITSMGGGVVDTENTTPNGPRSIIGFFSNYDAAARADITLYLFADGIPNHIREGYFWKPVMWAYENYGNGAAFVDWGDTNLVAYHNWGVNGTNSGSGTTVNPDTGETRFSMLQADRRAATNLDIETAIAAGRHAIVGVAMGMNELGQLTTYDNLLTGLADWQALGADVYFMMPVRPSPLFRADYEEWEFTCSEIQRAAYDADVALINTHDLFARGATGAIGVSDRELADATITNHPGIQEQNAVAQRVIDILV